MRILHITPHLGGGVGKAHAAMAGVRADDVQQTFVLLEEPRDRRFAATIEAAGAQVVVVRDFDHVAERAAAADIVQFDFWNHPRLFACLARCALPEIRSVFWSHISGLGRPVIQPGLIDGAGRFVFTTDASLAGPSVAAAADSGRIAVINSGFGFPPVPPRAPNSRPPRIAYLGTVDFAKMHPGFFDAIDALEGSDIRATVWGAAEPDGEVAARARAMRHPGRVRFAGHTDDPAAALSDADIFFYPLQPGHYGTAENALIEAMSLGLAPVVLGNPAERAIVGHGETGLIADSIEQCAALLQGLLGSPDWRASLGRNAAREVAQIRTPVRSAQAFAALWRGLLDEPKRLPGFHAVVGDTPAEWFLATQCLPGEAWSPAQQSSRPSASKGTLAHFHSAFPDDPSLSRLAAAPAVAGAAA